MQQENKHLKSNKIGEYELNTVTLGDSYQLIKTIPDKSVDLIVTDPPYDIKINKNISVGPNEDKNSIDRKTRKLNLELDDVDICVGIKPEILDEFMRIMKKPNIYIWCNKAQVPMYLDYFVTKHECAFEIMTWCKTNPLPVISNKYLIDKEFCLYFRKGVKLNTKYERMATYWLTPLNMRDKQKYEHPTIKPLNIIKMLIENSSNEGDLVYDAFSGSGTTPVACKELKRNFIASEYSEKWQKISVDRLNGIDATGQISFF